METSLKSLETTLILKLTSMPMIGNTIMNMKILMKMKTLMKKAPQKATFWSTLQLTLRKSKKG